MDYGEHYQNALNGPMQWVRLDSDFMLDTKVRRLAAVGGWQYVGLYVALVACLARADGHLYDMADGYGWAFLRADLCTGGCSITDEELRAFVGTLADMDLIDRDMWEESGKLAIRRLMREAMANAESVARGRCRVDSMNAAKARKRGAST